MTRPWWAITPTYGLYGGYDTLRTREDTPLDRIRCPGDIRRQLEVRGYIPHMEVNETVMVDPPATHELQLTLNDFRGLWAEMTPQEKASNRRRRIEARQLRKELSGWLS